MSRQVQYALIGTGLAAVVGLALGFEIVSTRPVRQAVRAYSELITVGNRPDFSDRERLDAASRLCSARFLAAKKLALGPEGGIAGLPRTVNKNFQAWREGENVWICPTNRIGPVYQFVPEAGEWKYDGLVAILRDKGQIIPAREMLDVDEE
ncbi:MAG: hypothetical protein U0790_18265 [Isosphaeraceae bacterium]